ncbi:MAG: hypothetical protein H7061_13025, partial [Bdellovibrionaceae bacterium]|nr:hypothetical protein [Bdellovibrio sp.]
MKLLTINLIALFLLTACSSGNGDKPNSGRTSETVTYTHFSTETRGEFISECLQEGSEYYRERLIFQNAHHGSITTEPMQAPECAFSIDRAQRTTKFSYKITQSQNDITYLRLSFQDGPVTAVSIVLTDDGDSLQITFPERTVYYEKLSSTVAGPRQRPPRPTPDLLAFDQLGIGTWITRNCYAGSQANTSMRQIVKSIREGPASHVAA